jgi:hypothetical protein
MKTKVQSAMARRQERLYVQRRRLAVPERLQQLRNDEEAQRAARGQPSQRVADWWRPEGDGGETQRGSMCWSTSSVRLDEDEVVQATMDDGGRPPASTNGCGRTVGSWKTLPLRKSCNRAAEQAPDDTRRRTQWTDEWTDGWTDGRTNGRAEVGPEDHCQRAAGAVRRGLVEVPPPPLARKEDSGLAES